MNPDQTAPMEQSDLVPYCLQYRLPKQGYFWDGPEPFYEKTNE